MNRIGIAGNAFNTTNVNTIYISPGVRNISPYAYYGENDLEIIFREDLYIDYLAFAFHLEHSDQAQLKITCPEACTNRLGNTYAKLATSLFHAVYTPLKEDAPTPPDTNQSISFEYRLAEAHDVKDETYINDGNDIVITRILEPSPDIEEFIIPSYIDGKRVLAIMPYAVSGSYVKTLVLGSSIRVIWEYAFQFCPDLSDIYFAGEYLDAHPNAFGAPPEYDETLTIHCSATCQNAYMQLYKNTGCILFCATWEEWNGEL